MPKKGSTIDPINANMDEVAEKLIQPSGVKRINNNDISGNNEAEPAVGHQFVLDVSVAVEKIVDGVEMGVLENGIPFLTQTGLSEVCGVTRSVIYDISQDWIRNFDNDVLGKDRNSFLKEYLFTNGYKEPSLYIETESDGAKHYSYPDIVCMAIIEYYAFEAKNKSDKAIDSYRKFAKYGLQRFIYDSVGYQIHDKWRLHNERQSILRNRVPAGYFSVFHEINPLTLDLIHADLPVNDKTVPDGSVGRCWSDHWKTISHKYADRIKYPHDYPDSYRQSRANGYIEPFAYPDAALPEFRRWFREVYLRTKFPAYILTKANVLAGGKEQAKKIATVFASKQLPSPSKKIQ